MSSNIVPDRSRDDLILMGVEILNGLDTYEKTHYSEGRLAELPLYELFDVSSQMIREVSDIRYMYFMWLKEIEVFVTVRGIKNQWLIEAGLMDAVINTGVVGLGVDAKAPFINGLLADIKSEAQRKIDWLKSLPVEKELHDKTVIAQKKSVSEPILKKLSGAIDWEEIRLEFFDDGNRAEIFIKTEKVGGFHFDELGFKMDSSAQTKAVNSWGMLQIMAMNSGRHPSTSQKDNSTKKDLQKKLRTLFANVIGDPITYSESKGYICRIRLVNKPDARNDYLDARYVGTVDENDDQY